jgi:hypothetical protein
MLESKLKKLEETALTDIKKTVDMLRTEHKIEVSNTYGIVFGEKAGGDEPISRTVIYGNGASFAHYVRSAGGKTVQRGVIIYKRVRYDNGDFEPITDICEDGLAFLEKPNLQVFFIPTFLQTMREELVEEDE